MNNNRTPERGVPPEKAYPPFRRLKNALWFIKTMKERGQLEVPISRHVGPTYGLSPEVIKRIKRRHRNELSFSEGK